MGATSGQEFSGKSVDEAVAEGLRKLGLRAEDASIEVINRGSRGLFGIGSEPAVVRIAPRSEASPAAEETPAPSAPAAAREPMGMSSADLTAEPAEPDGEYDDAEDEAFAPQAPAASALPAESALSERPVPEGDEGIAAMAADMLATVIRLMGFHATVGAEWRDADAITDERHLLLSARGDSLSPLIGRRGDTLDNIQYLLRLMVNQKLHRWLNIIVDVEEYRSKRVDHLTHLALRMADQVADTGRSFALEPMPPNERRIIHLALRDHPHVFTESTGDAERRKVNIFPKK